MGGTGSPGNPATGVRDTDVLLVSQITEQRKVQNDHKGRRHDQNKTNHSYRHKMNTEWATQIKKKKRTSKTSTNGDKIITEIPKTNVVTSKDEKLPKRTSQ